MPNPSIYFYIPQKHWPSAHLLEDATAYWQWQNSLRYGQGRYNWTLQTYLQLKKHGVDCQLVGEMPESGIILAHSDFLRDNLRPNSQQLLVCLRADQSHHNYAQLHVIQNRQDVMTTWSRELWPTAYMPHWPQSGLIPRDGARGDRFETVAFFGQEGNLAPELQDPSWAAELAELGLSWRVVPFESWHDYSAVDVVMAVRSFDDNAYNQKPASKLYNCWMAGVPGILGPESAYVAERQGDRDYVEVRTVAEAVGALRRLRDDGEFRREIVAQGVARSAGLSPAGLSGVWGQFLEGVARPAYGSWVGLSGQRQGQFLADRTFRRRVRKVRARLGGMG